MSDSVVHILMERFGMGTISGIDTRFWCKWSGRAPG